MEKTLNGVLDIFTSAIQQLSSTILLQSFQSTNACSEDESVDSLYEILLELLDLGFLLRPGVSVSLDVDQVDILMIFDQSVDALLCKFEDNFMLRNHVDVNNICFDVSELIVEHAFDKDVIILNKLRVGLLW